MKKRKVDMYVLFFLMLSSVIIGLLAFFLSINYRQASQSVENSVQNEANILASRVEATLRRIQAVSDVITQNILEEQYEYHDAEVKKIYITKRLNDLGRIFPEILGHLVFNASGDLLYSSNPAITSVNIADRTYFRELQDTPRDGLYFSETLLSKSNQRPSVVAYQVVRSKTNEFAGLVATPIDLDYFNRLFSQINLGEGGQVSVRRVDTSRLVVCWPAAEESLNAEARDIPPQKRINTGETNGFVRYASTIDGVDRIVGFRAVTNFPYYVLVGRAADEQFAGWKRLFALTLSITLFVVSLLGFFLYFLRRSESLLAKTEQDYRAIVEHQQDAICRWLPDTSLSFVNAQFASFFAGTTHTDLLGSKWFDLLPEADRQALIDNASRAAQTGQTVFREYTCQLTDGTQKYIHWLDKPIYNEHGKCVEFQSIGRDITDRKHAEIALSESEQRMRTITDTVNDAILMIDNDGNTTFWNPAAEKIFGYTREETLGRNLHKIIAPEKYHPRYEEGFRHFQQTGEGMAVQATLEMEAQHKNGSIFMIELSIATLKVQEKWHAVGVVRDISKRKEEEKALKESEARFKALHDGTFGGIAIHDFKQILECNNGLAEVTGYSREELLAMSPFDLIAPLWREVAQRNARLLWDQSYEVEGLRKDGTVFPLYLCGKTIPFRGKSARVVEYRDISEQKQVEAEKDSLQKQLIQAQKIEAIGTLAGGIAHDFNNILGAVIGYAEMARESSTPGSEAVSCLDRVLEASQRASSLVGQILAFSRQAETQKIIIDPTLIVKEVIKLLRASLPSTIALQYDCGITRKSIFVDPTQLHQILMNLCTNAYHAMEESGGRLSVQISHCLVDSSDLINFPKVAPGEFVSIRIEDTGDGIPASVIAKMYEPYFTTKKVGEGTGLGLSIVHGIVTDADGFITCESAVGRGTIFTVFFPARDAETAVAHVEQDMPPRGSEHILFVDDEPFLAQVGKEMFERLGYRVTIRTSSIEALTTFLNQPDLYDLVITDQTMPGMTGLDMAKKMLALRPLLPVILCTGFSKTVDEQLAKSYGIKAFALKPLARFKIASLVRTILDNPGGEFHIL